MPRLFFQKVRVTYAGEATLFFALCQYYFVAVPELRPACDGRSQQTHPASQLAFRTGCCRANSDSINGQQFGLRFVRHPIS